MADGSGYRKDSPGEARLGHAAAGRATLWARCACGREAVLDPAPWLGQGLARHPLAQLQDRVRCRCGARQARLEVRGLAEAPPQAAAGGLFIFR